MELITTISWGFTVMPTVFQMVILWMLYNWIKEASLLTHIQEIHQFPQPVTTDLPYSEDRPADKEIFFIVLHLIGKSWKDLTHRLLPDSDVDTICHDYHKYGMKEMMYQALVKWKQLDSENATVEMLAKHLEEVERKDIAIKIWQNKVPVTEPVYEIAGVSQPIVSWTTKKEPRNIQKVSPKKREQLIHVKQEELKPQYLASQMAGLPWMDEVALSLDEYYVDLKMVGEDAKGRECQSEEVNVPDIFEPLEGEKEASRILIEGGPGFGKTTLVTKIAHDWAKKAEYIQHFDLVIVVQLRNYRGNLEDMLIKATGIKEESHRDVLLAIFYDKSKKILLMLDGFDELPEDQEGSVLALLRSELPPHVIVLVTSRPGKFTSNRKEEENWCTPDIRTSGNYFLDKRVSIKGLVSTEQQVEFVQKHTDGNSDEDIKRVKNKLESMVEKEFLECPLFLLTFIVLFTNDNAEHDHKSSTKTDLFKQVFNYVVRRYYSKRMVNCPKLDLFTSANVKQYAEQVALVYEFGQFALAALKSNQLVYSKKEILTHDLNLNPEILELGFLQQSVYVEGFREEILYQPVHKTLFEFAAAYCLWLKSAMGQTDEWKNQICSVRPRFEGADSSLLFPFLIGLFGEKAKDLFQTLRPYKSEYIHCFGPLGMSMMQTELSSSLLTSLNQFLSASWKIPWCRNDCDFSLSIQHKEIIRHATKTGKVQYLTWSLDKPARLPSDFSEVEKLELILKHPVASLQDSQFKRIKCKELICSITTAAVSEEDWLVMLSLIPSIRFRFISFFFPPSCCSLWFPRIYKAATDGCLQYSIINWITFTIDGNQDHDMMSMVTDLIKMEKIRCLRLVVSLVEYSLNKNTPQVNANQKQLLQHDINVVVACAASSSTLRRFSLVQESYTVHLALDIDELCHNGKKKWEGIHLESVDVRYQNKNSHSFSIKYLELPSDPTNFTNTTVSFLNFSQILSLAYCRSSVIENQDLARPLHNTLTEIQIAVDLNLFYCGMFSIFHNFKNVQVVALGLPYAECPVLRQKMSVDRTCVLGSLQFLKLKRIEIWWRTISHELAKVFVKGILQCLGEPLNQKQCSEPESQSERNILTGEKRLQLQYLSLHTDEVGNFEEVVDRFVYLASICKKALSDGLLPALELICRYEFPNNLSKLKPRGISSWVNVFSPEQGYRISHHLWGTKPHDSVWGKEMKDMAHMSSYHVFTVRL